jgi:hypothetical protein
MSVSPHHNQSNQYDYGLDDQAIKVRSAAEAKGFFLELLCPDQLWGPPSLLSSGHWGVLPPGVKCSWGMMLTTYPFQCQGHEWEALYLLFPWTSMVCSGTALHIVTTGLLRVEVKTNQHILSNQQLCELHYSISHRKKRYRNLLGPNWNNLIVIKLGNL